MLLQDQFGACRPSQEAAPDATWPSVRVRLGVENRLAIRRPLECGHVGHLADDVARAKIFHEPGVTFITRGVCGVGQHGVAGRDFALRHHEVGQVRGHGILVE